MPHLGLCGGEALGRQGQHLGLRGAFFPRSWRIIQRAIGCWPAAKTGSHVINRPCSAMTSCAMSNNCEPFRVVQVVENSYRQNDVELTSHSGACANVTDAKLATVSVARERSRYTPG